MTSLGERRWQVSEDGGQTEGGPGKQGWSMVTCQRWLEEVHGTLCLAWASQTESTVFLEPLWNRWRLGTLCVAGVGQPRPEPLSLLLVGGLEAVTSHSPETVLP